MIEQKYTVEEEKEVRDSGVEYFSNTLISGPVKSTPKSGKPGWNWNPEVGLVFESRKEGIFD